MRAASTLCLLVFCAAAGTLAAEQNAPQKLTLAQNLQANTVSTNTPWVLPLLSEPNKTCTASCNGEDVDQSDLHSDSEAKSCVGTFQIFCKGNSTNGAGAFGAKCEGQFTTLGSGNQTASICEGAFQSFAIKGFKAPDGKFVKSTRAYGCLGSSIGLRARTEPTSLSNIDWKNFELNATTDELVSAGSGPEVYAQARCDGLNGRFNSIKLKGPCNKHHGKDDSEHPMPSHSEEGSQGRHLLDDHKDKHRDHAGKHHDGKEGKHGKHVGKDKLGDAHDDKHKDKKSHKHESKSFEDVQDKAQHAMRKASFELLPHALPRGSGLSEGPQGPACSITCNGRRTWFGAFFPCFGELVVDCGPGQHKPSSIANSPLDAEFQHDDTAEFNPEDIADFQHEGKKDDRPHGPPAFHGTCKGFWSGALFKTCSGFSSAHIEAGPAEVWDFCSGKKAVRMGGAPGKGFSSGSWCKGKDLLIVDKE